MSDQPPTVHVFFDYVCPYAAIGKHRADVLEREYDVELNWLPWEIYPNALPQGQVIDYEPPEANRDYLARLADEVDLELEGPDRSVNSNLALRGALYAQDEGEAAFRAYNDAAFEAIWSRGENLGDRDVLASVVEAADLDVETFFERIQHHSYQYRLDLIDTYATEKLGVQRVPTFVFGDQAIVGNDPFEPSLKRPLEAFLERWKTLGPEGSTTKAHDVGLHRIG